MGADKGIHVTTNKDIDKDVQPIHVAQILKNLIRDRGFDFVILGKQSIDDDFGQTGQILSVLLNWPQLTFISKMDFDTLLNKFLVEREVDGGIQALKAPLNSVFTCDLRLNKPRQAKLTDIMKSKNKPIESLTFDSFDLKDLQATRVVEVNETPKRAGGVMVKDVDELILKLRNEAKVI